MNVVGVIRGIGSDITEADDAFLSIVGYSRADFTRGRMDWREMTPPEYANVDNAAIGQAIATGFSTPYQKEFLHRDGNRVPVLVVGSTIPDTPGAWMCYVVDVSAPPADGRAGTGASRPLGGSVPPEYYEGLVTELVRERARMVAMLDNTDALFWAIDREFRLLSANTPFLVTQRASSGRDIEIGERVLEMTEYPSALIAQWHAGYERAFAGETNVVHSEFAGPHGLRHREAVLSPIREHDGRVSGVSVFSYDSTARTAAERALQVSEARFRSLAAASPLGIFLTDPAGQAVYVNPRLAAIADMTPGEMLGTGYMRAVHDDDVERVAEMWRTAMERTAGLEMEFRVSTPAGNERYVRTQVAPIHEGGVFTGYVGTVDDITERRAVAQRLRQRDKMESLGTLAGGIAHDFNNMLGVVLGYTELALLDAGDPDAVRGSLEEIRTASLRARDLVRQILTFSRRSDREHTPVELSALVRESIRLLRPMIPGTVQLEVVLPDEPLSVMGDATALQQTLVNLCTNAEYAMRGLEHGRLTVRIERDRRDPEQVMLLVQDSGVGMSTSVRERVFEPFFTTKPQGEGTGMGLAMVHGIVRAHRGTISVHSAPGAGTAFRVMLPLVAAAGSDTTTSAGRTPRAHGTILVVEDEPALARFAAQALERAGYTVHVAHDGEVAYERCVHGALEPDLVLSDVAMPRLTGDRLASRLRSIAPALPVVLMTGFSHGVTRDDAERLGVSTVLYKPIGAAELVRAVTDALERARLTPAVPAPITPATSPAGSARGRG